MSVLLKFDDFTQAPPHEFPVEDLPGYAAGFKAAQDAACADQARLTDVLVEAVTDWNFSFAEARRHMLISLSPLFDALVKQILPQTCDIAFRAALVDRLQAVAAGDASQSVKLRLSPEQFATLAPTFNLQPNQGVQIESDSSLATNSAILTQDGATTLLDIGGLFDAISETLNTIFDETDKGQAHGS